MGFLICLLLLAILYMLIAIILIIIFVLTIILKNEEKQKEMRVFKETKNAYNRSTVCLGEWKLVDNYYLLPKNRIEEFPIGNSIGKFLIVDKIHNPRNRKNGFLLATFKE